jgi:tetratricopeptide (TPR) repeat protein
MQEPVTKQSHNQGRIGLKGHPIARWPGLLALAAALCLLVWLFPFGASAYHLEMGSRALARATSNSDHPDLDVLASAVANLEKALSWQRDNAYAYRLLSRAYLLQGAPAEAKQALIRYTALRPGDPLGWWELAQIYETMDMPEQAIAAWRSGGFIAQDFIDAGDEARQANKYKEALEWYLRAGRLQGQVWDLFPEPFSVQSLIVLESFVTLTSWVPCPWMENVDGHFDSISGILEMSFLNTIEQRDRFAFTSFPNVPTKDSGELLLRLKGEPGTVLTLEVIVDGKLTRLLNYRPVPQDWEVWSLPISGDILKTILIGIGEDQPKQSPNGYRLFIDWIALR